ncbi:MAG: N-6 DNA methylase [Faecalibacterium prausnitzii]
MFVQSAALVQSKQGGINRINAYGQEKEAATYRLAKMNLALRGISHNLGETNDSSFTHDLHKGLYFVAIILTPVLMSILSSENAQRVNQSKTYFTLDLLIGWHSTLLRVSRP